MNFRTTALLLVCVLVAGGLFWFSSGRTLEPVATVSGERLVEGGLMSVAVTFGERDYEIRRDGDGWAQVSPVYFPLKGEAGRRWEAVMRALVVLEEVSPGVGETPGLSGLALAPAAARVSVVTSEGAVTFGVGEQTLGGQGYLALDDGRVVLVEDGLHRAVYGTTPAEDYAEALPLPRLSALDEVRLERGRESVMLTRRGAVWSLRADALRRVREEVLSSLAWLTDETPVLRHVADAGALSRYGLGRPRARLTFSGPDRPEFLLELGRTAAVEGGAVFARLHRNGVPGPVVVVPLDRVEIAFASLDRFNDPRLVGVPSAEVSELVIEPRDGSAWVARDGGAGLAWVESPTRSEATTAAAVLDAVLGLSSMSTMPPLALMPGVEVESPSVAMRVRHGVTGLVELRLYALGGGWVAQRSDEPDPTDVTAGSMDRLLRLLPELAE